MEEPLPRVLVSLPEQLIGDRVLVRPFQLGDGDALYEAVDESRDYLSEWLPWPIKHKTPQHSEAYARHSVARWVLREDLALSVWDASNGRFLGGTGLHQINWEIPSFEIGYWIRRSAERQGYVTEAVRLVRELAFEILEANRVIIRCAVGNRRSIAVAERAGFLYEATHRNEARDPQGRLTDVMVFALTADDYVSLRDVADAELSLA